VTVTAAAIVTVTAAAIVNKLLLPTIIQNSRHRFNPRELLSY
jgi:hypothetical protein